MVAVLQQAVVRGAVTKQIFKHFQLEISTSISVTPNLDNTRD